MSSNSLARSSASFCGNRSTCMGPSVTFRSTSMCGNRLNNWNTIPILARTCRRCFSSASTSLSLICLSQSSSPSTSIVPESGLTRVIRRRSNVVLPEPLAPMMATRSAGATSKSKSPRTVTSPYALQTFWKRTIGYGVHAWSGLEDTSGLQSSHEQSRGITEHKKENTDDGERFSETERAHSEDLCSLEKLDNRYS